MAGLLLGFLGTIIPFIVVLTVIVFVHEMGHYLVARWNGIAIQTFSIGFGPELFGFNDRAGTRWRVSLIPLGGYVRFVGDMNATSATPDAEVIANAGNSGGNEFSGLYFELRYQGRAIDPMQWMTSR